MSKAKKILESIRGVELNDSRHKLNEKVEITTEDAKSIKDIFSKEGYNVEVTNSTSGSFYIDGLYNCGGRYICIGFDKGGFMLSFNNLHGCHAIPLTEALKLQKELTQMTSILDKISKVNPELV